MSPKREAGEQLTHMFVATVLTLNPFLLSCHGLPKTTYLFGLYFYGCDFMRRGTNYFCILDVK